MKIVFFGYNPLLESYYFSSSPKSSNHRIEFRGYKDSRDLVAKVLSNLNPKRKTELCLEGDMPQEVVSELTNFLSRENYRKIHVKLPDKKK